MGQIISFRNAVFNKFHFLRLEGQKGAFVFCKASSGGSGTRSLITIDCPQSGYKIPDLKEIAKSSIIFIVPLNDNIDDSQVVEADTNTLNVICSSCENEVPLKDFGTHKSTCTKQNNLDLPTQREREYTILN